MFSVNVYYTIKIICILIFLIPIISAIIFGLNKAIIQQHRYNKNEKYLKSHGYEYSLESTPSNYWYYNSSNGSYIYANELYDIKFKNLKNWVEKELQYE